MKSDSEDIFGNAQAYEAYMGRWSRLVAEKVVAWMDVAPQRVWLDVGAGTGILTSIILRDTSPARVVAIDLSTEYIEFARHQVRDQRVEFRVEDAGSMGFDAPQFDVAVAGLVLNFVPDPQQAVTSMTQAIRRGGMVAAYVWDYSDRMEMMRHFWDAAMKIDASAQEMDAGQRFAICNPDNLRSLFESLDLREVATTAIDIQTRFKDFDDYWLPFLGAQGSVSKYLRGLSDEKRVALREQLQRQLPTTHDGGISLNARAWAVKGTKA